MTIVSLAVDRDAALTRAVGDLRRGRLVVVPTDTVYGLAADPFNASATAAVFEAKGRPRSLPLPIMVARAREAWALAGGVPSGAVQLAASFWPGALTMILPEGDLDWDLGETNGSVAVRIPNHRDLLDLIDRHGPLAVTSANRSGEPTPPTATEVAERLGDAVALILDGGVAPAEVPSSIVDLTSEPARLVREGVIPKADLEAVLGRPLA